MLNQSRDKGKMATKLKHSFANISTRTHLKGRSRERHTFESEEKTTLSGPDIHQGSREFPSFTNGRIGFKQLIGRMTNGFQ